MASSSKPKIAGGRTGKELAEHIANLEKSAADPIHDIHRQHARRALKDIR
jgi:hypothetical protein